MVLKCNYTLNAVRWLDALTFTLLYRVREQPPAQRHPAKPRQLAGDTKPRYTPVTH